MKGILKLISTVDGRQQGDVITPRGKHGKIMTAMATAYPGSGSVSYSRERCCENDVELHRL